VCGSIRVLCLVTWCHTNNDWFAKALACRNSQSLTTHTTLHEHCILQTGGHLVAHLVTVGSSGINFWGMTLTVGKHSRRNFNFEAILWLWLFPRGGYVTHCDNCTELNAELFQPCWHFRETPGSNCGTANASEFMVWYVCGGTANGFSHRLSACCKRIISTV